MRYFITSDIHSYYSVLKQELEKQGFDKDRDTLITLGDNFDRGDESWEMYEFLSKLPNVILVRGNHEDLLIDLVERGYNLPNDYCNKTAKTVWDVYEHYLGKNGIPWWSIEPIEKIKNTEFYRWITSDTWVDKIEFNNLILTHATIPIKRRFPTFKEARWADPTIRKNRIKDRILVCGHWFAWLARKQRDKSIDKDDEVAFLRGSKLSETKMKLFYEPYIGKNLIMIDACTSKSKHCNILIYDDVSKELSYNNRVICHSTDKYISNTSLQ